MSLEDKVNDLNKDELNLIDKVKKKGLTVKEFDYYLTQIDKSKIEPRNYSIGKTNVKFGVISDTHIGSKYYDSNLMTFAAKEFTKEKVDFVIHTGDIIEGMYPSRGGQLYELSEIGIDSQIDKAVKELSKIQQPIYFITGNHDYTSKRLAGVVVGTKIEDKVPNSKFLGEDYGRLTLKNDITIDLVHPGDGSCFDDKTEILTENGWKLFEDLSPSEKVATLNENKETLEWQEPIHYTNEDYEGDMFHFKARSFDMMVTPNHRMLLRKYNTIIDNGRKIELEYPQKSHKRVSKEWTFKTAKELENTKRQEFQMRRGGISWEGKLTPFINIPFREHKKFGGTPVKHIGQLNIEDIAELIAWYVTEGYIDKKHKSLNICQSERVNPDNHYQILDLFDRIGFNPKPRGFDNKDIVINSVELCEWLVKECGTGSKNKYLPKWLKNQPKDILEIIFETMIKGDGWINHKGFGYKSISKQLRDDFSEISLKLGYGVTENKDTITVSNIQIYPTINTKPEKLHYSGKIYCVQVPNDNILVRRNGKIIWSKNSYAISYKSQKRIDSLEGGDKPNLMFIGHYHKAEYIFYRNIHCFQSATLESQTPFMKSKGLAANKGFYIINLKTKKGQVDKITPTFYPAYD